MRALACLLLCASLAVAEKPRLVVVLSIDQMRPDTLVRFRDEYTGGLKRVLERGAQFKGVLEHAATQTGPGHATMLTGRHPARSGIVANRWLDRATLEPVYCCGDEKHERSPKLLLCDALGDWMKAADACAQVYSLSAKDRAAVLMGGKRPDGAFWLGRDADGFVSSTAYFPGGRPAWLAAFNGDGWLDRLPATWTYEVDPRLRADDSPGESPRFGRAAPHPLKGKTLKETFERLYYSPYADEFTLRLAHEVVKRHDLGGDDVPDLLCVSLSATDTVGHLYGPFSQETRDSTLRLDRHLGAFFDMLDKRGPWVLALTSDHGVLPITGLKRVPVVQFFARVERRLQKAVGHGGLLRQVGGYIYVDRKRVAKLGLDVKKVVHAAAGALRAEEDIETVFVTSELDSAKGELAALVRNSHHPARGGDLILIPKRGVLADRYGSGTSHGSPWKYDREVPLVFMGCGIRPGPRGPGRTIDIAPTLARMLGIAFPKDLDGRALGLE